MRAVHAAWDQDRLWLWAEAAERVHRGGAIRLRRSRQPLPHPFAAPGEDLLEILEGLAPKAEPEGLDDLLLSLPTEGGRPVPSPELSRGAFLAPTASSFERWSLPALVLEPAAALELLTSRTQVAGSDLSIGCSLVAWREAAAFALELVARGRFRPAVIRRDGGWEARWLPGPDTDDRIRTVALARALPAVAGTTQGGSDRDRIEGFLGTVIDAAVRRAQDRKPKPRSGAQHAPLLAALATADAGVPESGVDPEDAARELDAWWATALPPPAEFRTCFRLEEPEGEEADGRSWQVRFLLQATTDPSLLVPADAVWRAGRRLTAHERSIADPQEALLADLGRASRLWPDLEAALGGARPESARLTPIQAHAFLTEQSPALAQAGFGVLLPSWWAQRQARLGVRLRVKSPAGDTGTGLMTKEGLVDYRWEAAVGDQTLTETELRRLAALKTPLVNVRGRWVEITPVAAEAALALLQQPPDRSMAVTDVIQRALGLPAEEASVPILGVCAEGWLGALLDGAEGTVEAASAPDGFSGELRPYQERGLGWLRFLEQVGFGACLADDMGLGKTIQLLALLASERADGEAAGPTLLVCPMSVVGNWQRECERFTPMLQVLVHHGGGRLREHDFQSAGRDSDLVITTYALVARDIATLATVNWGRVVLDEAQNVKNSATRQSRAVRKLATRRRAALTGTPVENRLSDLWSIMEFLNPGLLGPAEEFRRRVAIPIERYHDEAAIERLQRITRPFVLRRLKTDRSIISDLPEKLEMKVYCNLTREQATLYQAVLNDMLGEIEGIEIGSIERRGRVLAAIAKLKQVCNHPAHLLKDGSRLPGRSGKLARLCELLEEALAEGDRALVFTQFAEWGERLAEHLRDTTGREILFLHGGTPKNLRDTLVGRFQQDRGSAVFVLSLKAGGTGLNLTAANQVIHYDRWWNPAVEEQATDRAFRIGQKRAVQVRKLVCVGTLEERIDTMIEAKRGLAEKVVGSGEAWLTQLSTRELGDVLSLSKEAVAE